MGEVTEFQFGDWQISPESNTVSNGDARTQLEPRAMAVLRYLCRHPGAVIPAEEILQACWGSNELGDNPVHKAITQLRRAFGDSSTEPRYIETIRKRGYRAIAPVVRSDPAQTTVWSGGSPFRGLEAFQENHAAIFFGRVQATAQLRQVTLAQIELGCPMVLVLGPSGSGKTSLVRAGLLPQLMAGTARPDEPVALSSTTYLDCADLGSGTLFQALAGALIDGDIDGQPLFPGASADSLGLRLAQDAAGVAAELRQRNCPKPRVGVFIDRLEAIFRADAAQSRDFIATLEQLARSQCLLLVLACRNDFYPEIIAQPLLMELKARGGHFDVMPPDGADIAQIVRQPARAANLRFEQDVNSGASLDDVLCDAARGSPDTLPLLQYCLNELYRQRGEDGTLKYEVYRQLGGIEGAVGVRAEQVVSQLTPAQIAALPHVLSLLVNIGEEQTAVTSRRSPFSLLRTDDERELVRVMIEARLFVSELAGDIPSFGVAHEALLRQWPRIADWVQRHRSALQLRTRLTGQAARWDDAGRPRDLLLPRGIQVSQASELLGISDFSLSPQVQDYVRTSIRRGRFLERLRVGVTALIALLAVLTTLFGFSARSAQRDAERNRSEAEGLMTYMLGDFAEKLRPIGRLDLLDEVGNKALNYLGKSDASESSLASLVSRIKALRIIGVVHGYRGRSDELAQSLLTAKDLIQRTSSRFDREPDFLKEAGANAFLLGQHYQSRNEHDAAEKYFTEYKNYSDQFASYAAVPADGWLEQSYAHTALGTLAMARSDYALAQSEFRKSLALKRRAAQVIAPDDSKKIELANAVSWVAESTLKLGDALTAMSLYREEEAQLAAVPDTNTKARETRALSLMRQAHLSVAFGERQDAVRALNQAQEIMQSLTAKDPTNRTWQSRLLQARGRLVEAQLTAANASQSIERLQEISKQLEQLLAQDPRNMFNIYLSIKFRLVRASALAMLGRDSDALAAADSTISLLEGQQSRAPKDKTLISYLAEAQLFRADVTRRLSSDGAALRYCQQTRELLNGSSSSRGDYALLALQVRANLCLGDTAMARPNIEKLQTMGYREERYSQLISTHLSLKGKQ